MPDLRSPRTVTLEPLAPRRPISWPWSAGPWPIGLGPQIPAGSENLACPDVYSDNNVNIIIKTYLWNQEIMILWK